MTTSDHSSDVAMQNRTLRGRRLRTCLMVTLILGMPLTGALDLGGKKVNVAGSDLLLPFGLLLLIWQLLAGRIRAPLAAVFCLNMFAITVSQLLNFEGSLLSKGTIGMAVEIAKSLMLWLLFYLVVNLVESRRDFLVLLKVWLLGSVIVALTGIGGSLAYQMSGVENPFSLMFRAQGTLGDANLFAAHLALSFLLALLYLRIADPAPKWVYLVMPVLIVGIFLSASRGSTVAFAICLVLVWAGVISWRAKFVSLAVCAVLALLIAVPLDRDAAPNPFTERLASVSSESVETADRIPLWADAWQHFSGAPVFGIGRGNFRPLDESDPTQTGQVHNSYIGTLCETGMVGFLSYICFFLFYPIELLRKWLSGSRREFPTASRILLLSLLVVGLCGVTINIENYRGLWILVAVMEAHRRLYAGTAEESVSSSASLVALGQRLPGVT